MTQSSDRPITSTPAFQPTQAPEEAIGLTLRRGGEKLALKKVPNQFSVRLQPQGLKTDWQSVVPIQYFQSLPQNNLEEVGVNPDQLEEAMEAMRQSNDVAFASHVYKPINDPTQLIYLTDRITLQFQESVDEPTRKAIASEHGLREVKKIEGATNAFVYEVTSDAKENPLKITNRLSGNENVLIAEPDIMVPCQKFYRPQDTLYDKQWYLHNSGGQDLAANSHIFAEQAWDITRGNRSVVVAIADDSIDLNHPDFQGMGKIVAPRDFKDRDRLPMPESATDNHGTACAGVAVAEENGTGIVGVAPGCALMPIRTSGYLDDNSIEELFDWAVENHAAVISCSWGPSAIYFPLSFRQRIALDRAGTKGRDGKGCVIVFAAGNANRPIDGVINEKGWRNNVIVGETKWLGGFTVHPEVMAVSACTSLNKKSAYSNWGPGISVCAPSNNTNPVIWTPETGYVNTPPEIQTRLNGLGIFTADRVGSVGYEQGDFTRFFGGTSSATPVVAGVAALVLSANPDLTAREVRDIIEQSADKIVDADPDPQLGTLMGTYDDDGYSQWFGYGKVNAYQAVLKAQQLRSPLKSPSREIQGKSDRSVTIPDFDDRGARSVISISGSGLVRDIEVSVDIEHSYLGDIDVHLVGPNGDKVLLQGRTLGRNTQLQASYSLQTTPLLRRFINLPVAGNWELVIVDRARFDSGTLKEWQLSLGT